MKPAVPRVAPASPRINEPWRPMCDAPDDGTPVLAKIRGERRPRIISFEVLEGCDEEGQGGWSAWTIHPSDPREWDPPPSWTDGICWEINEDGKRSAPPTAWRPLDG